jgi:ribosomal protein S18 acetylase RimI-like enzyme
MSSLSIREFQEADRGDVIALWTDCGLVVPWNDPGKDIDRKLEVDPALFLVGSDDTGVVATVMGGYEGHRGWINYLAVSTLKQRRGYGQEIMKAVEELIEARGCPKINLQVRASNSEVVAFYQALGYCTDDVVGLGKRLVT